jgi:multiple sugar transport system substrate-binding protein
MISKRLFFFLAGAMLVLATMPLFANGSKESSSQVATSGKITAAMTAGPQGYPAYNGGPADITMWAWTSNENYSMKIFEKLYPKIKIKWSNLGGGSAEYTKVLTATSAGKGLPDVIMSEYLFAPQFMEYGSFQPINKWVPKQLYLKYFPAITLKWTSLDGKIYGTPQDSGAMTMVYRKDVFDRYGLTVPKTWAEFAADAAKLHSQNPNIAMTTVSINWVPWPLGMIWAGGGKVFDYSNGKWYIDFTNPTAEKIMNYWGKLIKENQVKAETWWTPGWYKEITNGQLATVINGGWFPEWLQLNSKQSHGKWRVANVPQWNASNPENGQIGGSGFYVSSQSKHPQAAADFVLWLNSAKQSLVELHNKSQLPILWSKVFTKEVAQMYANTGYAYFGGQAITPVSVKAMNEVRTAYTALPVMDYVMSSYSSGIKQFIAGQVSTDTFLQNWQNQVVAFMKKQGFNNLVVGQLP